MNARRLLLPLLLAASLLSAQSAPRQPALAELRPVMQRVILLPANDIRRVNVSDVPAGARIQVHYESHHPGRKVVVEVLRRNKRGAAGGYESVLISSPSERGQASIGVPEAGAYVVMLRQPRQATTPLRVGLSVVVEQADGGRQPNVTTLPTETRVAVAVFAAGFLWTVVLACGAPILRAFRRQRRQPSQIWYG